MLRRFLIAILLFFVIAVVVADRVGALVAAHVLAGKVQTDEGLRNRPTAKIGGFPFLTQAVSGKYHDIKITDHEVQVNEVPVTTLAVDLKGVHVPLSKILRDSVSQVPVDTATGTAFVSFSDANAYLASHLPAGEVVRLSPSSTNTTAAAVKVTVGGQRISLHGVASVTVSGNVVSVAISQVSQSGLSAATVNQLLSNLHVRFPLQSLPFEIQLHTVKLDASGITAAGGASHIVLGSHPQPTR